MTKEARLAETTDGLAPASDGWFVVNIRDAVWYDHDTFGSVCHFEGTGLEFPQLGINLRVLEPGQPNGRYHAESNQEDFLALVGDAAAPAARQWYECGEVRPSQCRRHTETAAPSSVATSTRITSGSPSSGSGRPQS